MKIKVFQGGYDKNLSYLIWCESTKLAGIIDASVGITEMVEFIESHNLIIDKIFITHTHHDHIYFLDDILYQFPQIQICVYKITDFKFNKRYRKLSHHEIIPIGKELITIIYTPGHYIDSICLWNRKAYSLFTGDTMFVGRTGRTISKSSNIIDLYESIYDKILTLPEKTKIYPGHHYGFKKNVTLKENKVLSQFFQCTSQSEFIDVMRNYEANR